MQDQRSDAREALHTMATPPAEGERPHTLPAVLPLLSEGLRPFFLCAAAYAALAPIPWALTFLGQSTFPAAALVTWHAHEMLFGFASAALAGFLLTALPTWTQTTPIAGQPLAMLVVIWLAGRIAMASAGMLPAGLAAIIDSAFLPSLAAAILIQPGPRAIGAFWPFPLAVLGLGLLDLLWHAQLLGFLPDLVVNVGELTVMLFSTLIVITIGRIVPVVSLHACTVRGVSPRLRPRPGREQLAIVSMLVLIAALILAPSSPAVGWIALAAAAAQLDRLADWQIGHPLLEPYVWPLHAAYAWLGAGLVLLGLERFGMLAGSNLHALTMGAIGTAILAVLSIAGRRHTGRRLEFPPLLQAGFGLLTLAALLRVTIPFIWPDYYVSLGIAAATVFWSGAFAIYLALYSNALITRSLDANS